MRSGLLYLHPNQAAGLKRKEPNSAPEQKLKQKKILLLLFEKLILDLLSLYSGSTKKA